MYCPCARSLVVDLRANLALSISLAVTSGERREETAEDKQKTRVEKIEKTRADKKETSCLLHP
jgi:hypothetical protein